MKKKSGERLTTEEQVWSYIKKELNLATISDKLRKKYASGKNLRDNHILAILKAGSIDAQKDMLEVIITAERLDIDSRNNKRRLREIAKKKVADFQTPSIQAFNLARESYFLRKATFRSDVKNFRKYILKDGLLTSEQAYDFISSWGIGLEYDQFVALKDVVSTYPLISFSDVPLVKTKINLPRPYSSMLPPPKHSSISDKSTIQFEPYIIPTDSISRMKLLSIELNSEPATRIFSDSELGSYVARYTQDSERNSFSDEQKWLAFPGLEEEVRLVFILPNSVGDKLREISINLAEQYRWKVADATWFVLTGTPPITIRNCLDVDWDFSMHKDGKDFHGFTHLIMRVEPWVPAKDVLREYQFYQKLLLNMDRSPQPITEKKIRLFYWVQRAITDNNGKRPRWEDLLKLWNTYKGWPNDPTEPSINESWKFKDIDDISESYRQTKEALLEPANVFGKKKFKSKKKDKL